MFARLLLPDPQLLHPLGALAAPEGITVVAVTVSPTAACPRCGALSSRAHSNYLRHLADLPSGRVPVCLNRRTRRSFCDAPTCPQRTFTERLPAVAAPCARRTLRLSDTHRELAHALGGEPGPG